MDNQTRRILLERVKASGFPGSILDVFQNPAILDQFIAEQQQSQLQQPQNIQVVAETPEQQRQGLRPYHNNNITNVEMAFPNVEANQSINTIGMKGNINVDVIKQGNLVQSFKAIPPGIANFPTGSPEGATLIESPAKGYQKGGFHQRIYTDPIEFAKANEAHNDSLRLYNNTKWLEDLKFDGSRTIGSGQPIYGALDNASDVIDDPDAEWNYYNNINANIKPIAYLHEYYIGFDGYKHSTPMDGRVALYKKPTEKPVYREKLNLQTIPYKGLSINSNPPSLGDMTSIINSSPLSYKYQLQPGVYGNQIRVGVYQDGKYQPFNRERIQNEIEENRIPDQREENYLRIQKLKGYQTGGVKKYQTGSFDADGIKLTQVNVEGEKPAWAKDRESKTPDNINWYETINFKKWGLKDYSDYSSFNSAFRNARESQEKEFVWNDKRYNTDLVPKETSDKYWDAKKFLKDYYTNEPFTPLDTSSIVLNDFYDDYSRKKYGYTWLEYFNKIKNTPQYLDPQTDEDLETYSKYRDTLDLLDNPMFYSQYSDEAKTAFKDRAKNKYIEALNDPSYYFSITSKPDSENPILGYVDSREGKNKMYVSDTGNINDFTTFIHELSHKGDSKSRIDYYSENSRIPEINVDKLNKYGIKLTQDRFNYVSDPSETEARKMSTLYFMDRVLNKDIKSGKITKNDLDELYSTYNSEGGYEQAKSIPEDIQDLLELYKWQKDDLLKYLNNDFSYIKPTTKKTGGVRTYLKGGLKNRVLYNKAKYKR